MAIFTKKTFDIDDLDSILQDAKKKVGASSVNELSHYLPTENGYRMHHFTLVKLKKTNPKQLKAFLKQYISGVENPKKLNSRPRKSASRSKGQIALNLEAAELQAFLRLARKAENQKLVEKLKASLPISTLKKEMLRCVKEEKIDIELWNSYVEAIKMRSNI